MSDEIKKVKVGIGLIFFGLLLSLSIGLLLNTHENAIKNFINGGIAMHPLIHTDPAISEQKIWKYTQHSYYYAISTASISIALILLTITTTLRSRVKSLTAALIGCINFYPLSYLNMLWLSPHLGIQAANDHLFTQLATYSPLIGGIVGITILVLHIYFNLFHERTEYQDNYRQRIIEYKY